jgi:hypothetical protein
VRSTIECPAEPVQLLAVSTPTADDHPGWNISDDIELPAHGECRYVVELVRGQTVTIEAAGAYPIEISVWDDDTYERLEGACHPDVDRDLPRGMGVGSIVSLAFPVPETGVYDVVVKNPEDWLTDAAVRIVAPPIP